MRQRSSIAHASSWSSQHCPSSLQVHQMTHQRQLHLDQLGNASGGQGWVLAGTPAILRTDSSADAPQAHGVAEEQVCDRAVQQQRRLRYQPVDARLKCLRALRKELGRALPAVLQGESRAVVETRAGTCVRCLAGACRSPKLCSRQAVTGPNSAIAAIALLMQSGITIRCVRALQCTPAVGTRLGLRSGRRHPATPAAGRQRCRRG